MKTIEQWIEQNWMHFRDCWVVMNEKKEWWVSYRKPEKGDDTWRAPNMWVFPIEDIEPVSDWTKSLQQIKKPVNPNDWIGKLCWFDNNRGCEPVVGILREVVDGFFVYRDDVDTIWERCRPLTEEEMKNLISKE